MSPAEKSADSSNKLSSPIHELKAIYTEIGSVANSIGQKALELANGYDQLESNAAEVSMVIKDLTLREIEVLGHVSYGMSNSEVAKQLWVAEQTVKFHLSNIYRKLEVRNRTEASNIFRNHSG